MIRYEFSHEHVDLYFKLLELIRTFKITLDDDLPEAQKNLIILDLIKDSKLDLSLGNLSFKERTTTEKFFSQIIDQPAFYSDDYKRIRQLLIDWYSAHKTMVSSKKSGVDPYLLSNKELDELIKSFGFPYPNKIINKDYKIQFLLSLIQNYKRKGTPEVFHNSLKYFGLNNSILYEWWLDKNSEGRYIFRSKPVYPRNYKYDESLVLIKSYSDFIDAQWQITEDEINQFYENAPYLFLPSLTPFISISSEFDSSRLIPGLAILNRLCLESFEFWMKYVLITRMDIIRIENDPTNTEGVDPGRAVIIGDSPIGEFVGNEGKYAVKTQEGSPNDWIIIPYHFKNHCVKILETDTHWVFNGERWVNLELLLPSEKLPPIDTDWEFLSNKELYRQITLRDFEKKYNILEVVLAIVYLFKEILFEEPTDDRYISYEGVYAPFDNDVYPDNKIDNPDDFIRVYEEYNRLVNASYSDRNARDKSYQKYLRNFTREIKPEYTGSLYTVFRNCQIFLEAMNPQFKSDLDVLLENGDKEAILRKIIEDFELYLMKILRIIDVPFAFMITDASIYRSLKEVIDFFKPYRARITELLCSISFNERLLNTQLEKDELYIKRVDGYLDRLKPITDSMVISSLLFALRSYLFGRPGVDDPHNWFELGLKDILITIMIITFRNKLERLEDKLDVSDIGEEKSRIKTIMQIVFVDSCPGDQTYFDSSTILDSIEIISNQI